MDIGRFGLLIGPDGPGVRALVRYGRRAARRIPCHRDIHVVDWNTCLKVKEELNFRIMTVMREAGASFALPSRTLYLEGMPKTASPTAADLNGM